MPVRNPSAPAARRGRHLASVAQRSHVTAAAPGPRYYYAAVQGLAPVWYLRLNEKPTPLGPAFDGGSAQVNAANNGTITRNQVGPLVGDPTDAGYLYDGLTGFSDGGSPASLLANFQNHDFTIEAWVKPISSANFIFSCGLFNDATPGDRFLHFGFNAGVLKLGFFGDDLVGVLNVTTGVYHHIATTWSASTKLQALYLDGMLDSVRTSSGSMNVPGTADIQVARVAFATGNGPFWFNGTISELAVYPTVLSLAQLNSHYLLGINAVPSVVPKITLEV